MNPTPVRHHSDRERGASSLEMVLLLPFVTMTFLILVGLGYTLAMKQHALVAARFAATHQVVRGSAAGDDAVSRAASNGLETWGTSIDNQNPPAFVPFLSTFDSSGRTTCVAGSTPERGIIPHLFPAIPAATASFRIPNTTSTCKELGGSSYLTYIMNQGGVGEIFDTDADECCDTYEAP